MHTTNKNLKHAVMVVPIQGVDEFVFEGNNGLCLKKHMEILACEATFSKLSLSKNACISTSRAIKNLRIFPRSQAPALERTPGKLRFQSAPPASKQNECRASKQSFWDRVLKRELGNELEASRSLTCCVISQQRKSLFRRDFTVIRDIGILGGRFFWQESL